MTFETHYFHCHQNSLGSQLSMTVTTQDLTFANSQMVIEGNNVVSQVERRETLNKTDLWANRNS